ncbi:hypothetical protein Btru_056265 [Bulinus truncatus]|nr:hypothetical protein Btru_056265 [Bulinus truncatus]
MGQWLELTKPQLESLYKQQQIMAHHMKTVFGDKLVTDNIDLTITSFTRFLQRKIPHKVKNYLQFEGTEGYATDEDEGAEPEKKK